MGNDTIHDSSLVFSLSFIPSVPAVPFFGVISLDMFTIPDIRGQPLLFISRWVSMTATSHMSRGISQPLSTPHVIQGLGTRCPCRERIVGIRLPRYLATVDPDILVLDRGIRREIQRC